MNFINNFLNSFIGIFNSFFGSLSSAPTIQTGASYTSSVGLEEMDNNSLTGSTTITTASAVSSSASNTTSYAYDIKVTEAYIESMNQEELEEFIYKLENTNLEEKPKTLTKKL